VVHAAARAALTGEYKGSISKRFHEESGAWGQFRDGSDPDAKRELQVMYKSFFGLKENPFNVNPDPRFLFLTKQIEEALTSLMYGIQTRKGFITLTGEVGTGKTTLVNRLLEWLHHHRVKTAFLFNSRMNTNQLFDFILAEFDIACESRSKSQQLMKLNQWLLERYRSGETAVLILDEAQNLTYPVLEEIRLLTNLETSTEKLLQIVLSGQPELEEKLKLPQLRQLRQRITLRCKTAPLTKEQTHEYVAERLRIAGSNGQPIFSPKAIDAAYEYSQGIPRVVNLLCEHSLVTAYAEQQRPVQSEIVEEVAKEFELDEVKPIATKEDLRIDKDVYNSESFIQNLGEALSRFRVAPPTVSSTRWKK
jgi:general secretion pathway protein A